MADIHDLLEKAKDNVFGKFRKDKQKEFVDCCKEYKFIKKSNTISFNNKMNRLEITPLVLDEKYDQTPILLHDITKPIKYGAGTIIAVIGYTRSGKSELVQVIVMIIKQANKKYKNRNVKLYLCWTPSDFYLSLNKLKNGDIVWNDERPKVTGKGRLLQTWDIDNVLHSVAKRENTFIFVTPKLENIKVDICDLYLETAGMNFKTRTNRFMIMDDEQRYFGHIYVKLHNVKEFREWYEGEKDAFIDDISEKAGKIRAVDELTGEIEYEEEIKDKTFIDGINNEQLKEILALYKSKNTERDIEIYLRHLKGEIFEKLGRIYNLTKPEYHFYKVEKFVKENLD